MSVDVLASLGWDRVRAHNEALAGWAHVQRVVYHFTVDAQRERARSAELTQKGLALSGDATVLAVLGNALTLLGELDSAAQVVRKALAVDGGSAWAWSRSGWIDVYRGEAESAIERFKIALDLAPHDVLAARMHKFVARVLAARLVVANEQIRAAQ